MVNYTMTDEVDTTILPNIQRENESGGSGATPIPLPDQDPSEALLIPTQGATSAYSIAGRFIGTIPEIATFVAKIKKWKADGGKLSTDNLTYVSPIDGTASVRVANEAHDWNAGNPRTCFYSLELVEGTFG